MSKLKKSILIGILLILAGIGGYLSQNLLKKNTEKSAAIETSQTNTTQKEPIINENTNSKIKNKPVNQESTQATEPAPKPKIAPKIKTKKIIETHTEENTKTNNTQPNPTTNPSEEIIESEQMEKQPIIDYNPQYKDDIAPEEEESYIYEIQEEIYQ